MDRLTIKIRAISALARFKGIELREASQSGIRYIGVSGGDHVLRDGEGRIFRVDLVIGSVVLCVGLPPRVRAF